MQQLLCRQVHLLKIERIVAMPTHLPEKRVFLRMQIVFIGAAHRIETRMRIIVNRANALHGDIVAHHGIDLAQKFMSIGYGLLHIEMRNHGGGMHPGVGTSCPGQGNGRAQGGGKRLFKRFLHRYVVGLNLPSMKRCAAICQSQKIAHQSFSK